MSRLYYTIEKQTRTINDIEECTGWKSIIVYEIVNDTPKVWFEIDEARNDSSTENEIQTWLDNNGFEDREYKFIEL